VPHDGDLALVIVVGLDSSAAQSAAHSNTSVSPVAPVLNYSVNSAAL
jgi:hypothetical protein